MFQFPFRFLSLGTLLLCAAALFALQLLPERRAALAAAGLVCAALLTASITETNIMSAQGESSYATYNQNATINSVGTAEYLIDGASSYEAIWAQPSPPAATCTLSAMKSVRASLMSASRTTAARRPSRCPSTTTAIIMPPTRAARCLPSPAARICASY